MRHLLFTLGLTLSSSAWAADPSCPEAIYPAEAWEPAEVAAPEDAVAALSAFAFPDTMDDPERRGTRTDGLLVLHGQQVLFEDYGRDWTSDMTHLQWSATKTVSMLLTAIAVREGLLDIDASICDLATISNPEACAVTIRDLMEFGSGFAWRETYEGMSPTASSVIGMLFGAGKSDVIPFVTNHPMRDVPGTSYQYSTGDSSLMLAIVGDLLAKKHGPNYPWKLLFEPLGITSAVFESDAAGHFMGGSYLYLTPRDMARVGLLLHTDGCWNGERLIPEGWLAKAKTPAPNLAGRRVQSTEGALPGWNLWLNQHLAPYNSELPYSEASESAYYAAGHWGQFIFVLPEHDLIIARTGDDRVDRMDRNELFRLAKALIPTASTDESTGEAMSESDAEATDGPSEVPEEASANEEAPGTQEVTTPPEAPIERWLDKNPRSPAADAGAAEPPEKYTVGLLRIASSFAAKEACSCRYVSGRSEEACLAYIKVSPNVARAHFKKDGTVVAKSLGMGRVTAKYIDEANGCRVISK